MRKRAPRMRKLTTILLWWSTRAIEDINRLTVADSGDVLRRGTSDSRRQRPPLLDSYLPEDQGDKAPLLGHSPELEMISNDG
jgi:hypothetical protein